MRSALVRHRPAQRPGRSSGIGSCQGAAPTVRFQSIRNVYGYGTVRFVGRSDSRLPHPEVSAPLMALHTAAELDSAVVRREVGVTRLAEFVSQIAAKA